MAKLLVSFMGERVEEVMATVSFATSTQAMFPWCVFGGYFGEDFLS